MKKVSQAIPFVWQAHHVTAARPSVGPEYLFGLLAHRRPQSQPPRLARFCWQDSHTRPGGIKQQLIVRW